MLEVVQRLLRGRDHGREVLAVFRKLVARNGELELQLHELKSRRNKGEGVSTSQLLLLLEGLEPSEPSSNGDTDKDLAPCSPDAQEANEQLRKASGFGESCGAQTPPPQKPPPQPSVRRPFPEQLKRTEVVIRVPEDERACPKCSQEGTHIGYDTVEIADLEPAQVIVRVERREKLACERCEVALRRAPVGDRVVAGGRFGSRLVGQLLVDKYDDGLPLHRQKERLARLGLPIAISTLADQITWATDLLTPLWWATQRLMLTVHILHLGATGLPVLNMRVGTGKHNGTLWGYVGGETALYLYCSSGHKRGQADGDIGPGDFLARRKGYTVADAANLFDATFRREASVITQALVEAREARRREQPSGRQLPR